MTSMHAGYPICDVKKYLLSYCSIFVSMIKDLNRAGNLLLSLYSALRSSASGKTVLYGMPPALGIELTNHCNLRCPECASGSGQMKRERGFMDPELYGRVIGELGSRLYNVNLYFQGEPLLHPLFDVFIRMSGGIHSVLSTNGHYLTGPNCEKLVAAGPSKLIIPVDGADQETYSAYRVNGELGRVVEGLGNITEARRKARSAMKIEIQLLLNRKNERQVREIRKMASAFGVGFRLKSMQIISGNSFDKWLPADNRYRRYEHTKEGFRIRSELPARCLRLWMNPVITWDGRVLPCCFDKDAEYVMGNLNNESFRDIWTGTRYRLFRRQFLSDRSSIGICTNCTAGLKL
jgi:radical SAM protein with 4Fe4S-binding SPASM domain